MIPDSFIQDLLARGDIVALVDGHVSFSTKGELSKHMVNVTPAV